MCLRDFWKNQSGAVTVDWVVLTAAVVALATLAAMTFKDPMLKLMSTSVGYMSYWEDCRNGATVIVVLYGRPNRICN